MEFIYFLDAWKLLKVWSASSGFVVALNTWRIKDALFGMCSHQNFFLLPPLEVDTLMK